MMIFFAFHQEKMQKEMVLVMMGAVMMMTIEWLVPPKGRKQELLSKRQP